MLVFILFISTPVMWSNQREPVYLWIIDDNLVALFKQTIKHPVTFGSKVPECPVLSIFNNFLIQATISCEDGLAGLSKLITPYFIYSLIGLLWGENPEGIGV